MTDVSYDIRPILKMVTHMLTQVRSNQPMGKIQATLDVAEALKQAENRCKDCKTSSPMVCVERCDVWKVKNEIFSIRKLTSEQGHCRQLFNSIKNSRRTRILDALSERPRNLKDLQAYLRYQGFYHSRSTIVLAYIKPLISSGLIREESGRFKATFYGRKIREIVHQTGLKGLLPIHSCCYEEKVIKQLWERPKAFDELAKIVPRKSLARLLMRLRNKGLLSKRRQREYVFYHKAKNRLKTALSPTEKRVFNLIPEEGMPARQLSAEAKITLRRTYKYLRRLKEKKLLFALKKPRTYELTTAGREIAKSLNEIDSLALSTAMPLIQR